MTHWLYIQKTGELFRPNGTLAAVGYAGTGPGRNAPEMQDVRMTGPLPCGLYTIGPAVNSKKTGPVSIRLTPARENEMFGRSAFLIHGNNAENDASNGCIIMPRLVRQEVIEDTEHRTLKVVAYPEKGVA